MKKNALTLMFLLSAFFSNLVCAAKIATEYQSKNPREPFFGFYGGVNGGYTFANKRTLNVSSNTTQYCTVAQGCPGGDISSSVSAGGATNSFFLSNAGFIAGAQFGYNYNVQNNYIVGLEADIQGIADDKRNKSSNSVINYIVDDTPQNISTNLIVYKDINYFGTLRARMGYFLTKNISIIGTGGLAFGGLTSRTSIEQNYGIPANAIDLAPNWGAAGKYSSTRIGFATGGLLEWAFLANLSAKIEYLYYNLGTVTYNSKNLVNSITIPFTPQNFFTNMVNTTTRFDGHIIRLGLNYHFK